MIDGGLEAVVIKVAALGLDPSKHLGMRLQEIQPHLLKMVNIGEGNLIIRYLYLLFVLAEYLNPRSRFYRAVAAFTFFFF